MSQPAAKICIVCRREFPASYTECPDDRVRLSEKDVRIGTVFDGKYEILDFIGAGGISRVYKARHKELNRIVALKLLKIARPVDLQRFKREAVSVGLLSHPNIARVYALSVANDGNAYIAMEYLEGRDLAEILARDGSLSVQQATEIFRQVAAALEHAHSHKIIHRDIKPGNIILLSDPDDSITVKVVDFGMARSQMQTGEMQKLTLDGEIIGTRRYISPEQYRGGVADERADIFALGVSLYESVLSDGKIADELSAIINKCTESDPDKRYQSAKDLMQDLASLSARGSSLSPAKSSSQQDFFGRFFFWSMISGMIMVAVLSVVLIRQRLLTLEALSDNEEKPVKRQGSPLSFEATDHRAVELLRKERLDEAIDVYKGWYNRSSRSASAEQIAEMETRMADIYLRQEKLSLADACCRRALKLTRSHEISRNSRLLISNVQARLLRRQGKNIECVKACQEALGLINKQGEPHEQLRQVPFLLMLAESWLSLGDPDKSRKFLDEGIELSKDQRGDLELAYAEALRIEAELNKFKKDYLSAYNSATESLKIYAHRQGKDSMTALRALATKDEIAAKLGRKEEVAADYEYLSRHLEKHKAANPAISRAFNLTMSQLSLYLDRKEDLDKWDLSN